MIRALLASLVGLWTLGAGPVLHEFGIEFVSPRFFYEYFADEAAQAWQGGPPEVGWQYAAVGLFYLAILIYVFWRFRYLQSLRESWSEFRLRRTEARRAKAERARRLEAAEAAVAGVSYEGFHALAAGNRAFDAGRYDDALAAFEEAASAEPKLSAAWVGRGAALGRLGRPVEAREAFGEAVRRAPDNSEAWVNMGLAALEASETAAAREAFQRAVGLDGASARGYVGLAMLAATAGDRAEVLSHLEKALRLRPTLAEEVAREPAFSSLAREDGFRALLERFGPRPPRLRWTG